MAQRVGVSVLHAALPYENAELKFQRVPGLKAYSLESGSGLSPRRYSFR